MKVSWRVYLVIFSWVITFYLSYLNIVYTLGLINLVTIMIGLSVVITLGLTPIGEEK